MSKLTLYYRACLLLFAVIGASNILFCSGCSAQSKQKIVIVTGGHDFERAPFFQMFREMPGIEYQEVSHPEANVLYDSLFMDQFDVLVFYDMYQEIDDNQKSAFIELLEKGKGVVFLHHSLASYQAWDEFEWITGGRYIESGPEEERSSYTHDVEVPVQVVNEEHPITKGINDFVIHDEVYGNIKVLPQVRPILKTSHPESGEIIAWTNLYRNSRIVYIQLGHDHFAYENSNYRRLVKQAIEWAGNTENIQMIPYSRSYVFKDGLYLHIDDLRANDPLPLSRIVSDLNTYNKDFFEKMILQEDIILYDESGVRASVKTKDVWGYALNGQLYIMLGGKFQKIIIEGRISPFIAAATTHEKTRFAPGDTSYYTTTEDLYRSFNRQYNYSMVTAEAKMYLFDLETNSLTGFDIVSLGVLLERDPELSTRYKSLRKREKKEKMMEFIRRYNAKHPVYFPLQAP
jgi:type 1 glutamine amidotransferase